VTSLGAMLLQGYEERLDAWAAELWWNARSVPPVVLP
jgi:hypothetical protein